MRPVPGDRLLGPPLPPPGRNSAISARATPVRALCQWGAKAMYRKDLRVGGEKRGAARQADGRSVEQPDPRLVRNVLRHGGAGGRRAGESMGQVRLPVRGETVGQPVWEAAGAAACTRWRTGGGARACSLSICNVRARYLPQMTSETAAARSGRPCRAGRVQSGAGMLSPGQAGQGVTGHGGVFRLSRQVFFRFFRCRERKPLDGDGVRM